MIHSYINESILKKATEKKLLSFSVLNIRDYSKDKHRKVDDRPYGGGPGMVMTVQPIIEAVRGLRIENRKNRKIKYILPSPRGKMFTNIVAKKFTKSYSDIVFICGRYEGIDGRVNKILKAEEYSVGDYTVTGGELPALTMTDAIARQIPDVLGKAESVEENRITNGVSFTRPEIFVHKGKKYKVPKVLVEGNHKKIEEWRGK